MQNKKFTKESTKNSAAYRTQHFPLFFIERGPKIAEPHLEEANQPLVHTPILEKKNKSTEDKVNKLL